MTDYRDLGYNDLLQKKSVIEEQKKTNKELIERRDNERNNREKLRIQQIGDKNPLLYMIDQLIDLTIQKRGCLQLEPRPLEDLGIPDDCMKIRAAHEFLNQMQHFGCFTGVDRRQWNFVLTKPNLKKLKEYKVKLQNELREDAHSVTELSNKLYFSVDKGTCTFGDRPISVRRGTKMFALLQLFSQQSNTPFKIQDIIKEGNPLIKTPSRYFKGEKDIDDTLRNLREKLHVKKGEYFPIGKSGSNESVSWKLVTK